MTRSPSTPRLCLAALGALAAVAAPLAAQEAPADQPTETQLKTVDGRDAGTVTFRQAEHGVLVMAKLKNLTPGPHGFHIHETGACTPDFKAAGGHYNPVGSEHGFDGAGGYHVGDMPNIHVGEDGTAMGEFFVPQVSVSGPENDRYPYTLDDADGSAIMVHSGGDDYADMASAGDRVACGVIMPPRG
jgi:Cu-Zn family superoxide dismutase